MMILDYEGRAHRAKIRARFEREPLAVFNPNQKDFARVLLG
jgi:hypothetical protein